MARRKARIPQGKKIQPAVMSMAFALPGIAGANTDHTIDLSQAASLLNRKFFRQGLVWHVAGFTVLSNANTSGNIRLLTQQKTWVSSNSWHKGFASWQRMNRDALDESESIRPKFLDFKVYLDSIHHTKGSTQNLLPFVGYLPIDTAEPGTWDYSKIHVPIQTGTTNTQEFDILWNGASFPGASPITGNDAVSLIEGYAASRGLPDVLDPNAPSDASDTTGTTPENWMAALFNEGTDQSEEVIYDMLQENNLAPYPFENMDGVTTDTKYPGGASQLTGLEFLSGASVTATTVSGVNYLPGGSIPAGLLRVYNSITGADETQSAATLVIHMIPGHHRGYAATPMQDM